MSAVDEFALLSPATVVPAQWYVAAARPCAPERQLLAAVLMDAVALHRRGRDRRAKGMRGGVGELAAWFASDRRDYLCAFARICDILGLEPDRVRTALDDPHTIAIRTHMAGGCTTIREYAA